LIAEDEHRCHRCGRRLQESPRVYPVERSAAAPVLEPMAEPESAEPVQSSASGPARQVALFDDRPKIIPFESLTRRKASARRASSVRREVQHAAAAATAERASQQPLDLRAPAPRQKTAVSDDVPVAPPAARLQAAALDAIFLGGGIGAAAGAFYFMGGRVALSATSVAPCGVAVGAVAVFYHLFWCLLGRESAGTRCLGLRTLTFDGQKPSWQRLVARFLLALCSVGAVGIGALWALIDEEGLTWHDHITKTFPTECDPNPSTLRRR
jgi:uncharacterized RDD family membrane protein YckC